MSLKGRRQYASDGGGWLRRPWPSEAIKSATRTVGVVQKSNIREKAYRSTQKRWAVCRNGSRRVRRNRRPHAQSRTQKITIENEAQSDPARACRNRPIHMHTPDTRTAGLLCGWGSPGHPGPPSTGEWGVAWCEGTPTPMAVISPRRNWMSDLCASHGTVARPSRLVLQSPCASPGPMDLPGVITAFMELLFSLSCP